MSGGERALYQKKHSQEYRLHDFEKEELQRLGFIKIPSAEKLIFELEKLKSQESFEKENYQNLARQQKELSTVLLNFERMLSSLGISAEKQESLQHTQKDIL